MNKITAFTFGVLISTLAFSAEVAKLTDAAPKSGISRDPASGECLLNSRGKVAQIVSGSAVSAKDKRTVVFYVDEDKLTRSIHLDSSDPFHRELLENVRLAVILKKPITVYYKGDVEDCDKGGIKFITDLGSKPVRNVAVHIEELPR